MPDVGSRIQRIHNETTAITKQNVSMREVIAKSLEVLNIPLPDTFLGRKTHEPFPFEGEAEPAQPSATGDGVDGSRPDGSTAGGRPPPTR